MNRKPKRSIPLFWVMPSMETRFTVLLAMQTSEMTKMDYVHYRSSYVLLPDRSVIYPAGHDRPQTGTLPPAETTFPMGTFVEDYEYNPDAALDKLREKMIIDSETPERLLADTGQAGDDNPNVVALWKAARYD